MQARYGYKSYVKRLFYVFFILTVAICLVSCGDETPEMTEKEITEALSSSISDTFSFDKISDVTYEKVETTEEGIAALKEKYQDKVPYVTYECSATLENLDMIAKVQYKMVCAYNNNSWTVVTATEWNKDKWEYTAKKYPSERDIMNDISKYKFGSYEVGYVGDEKHSSVKIVDQVFNDTVNRETQDVIIEIKSDFGHYEVNAKVIYYFLNGEWTLGDFVYGDMQDWNFIYNDGCDLNVISDNQIVERMTDKNNFLTYSTNLDYVDDYKVALEYMDATKDTMSAVYSFDALYGFGTVQYYVRATYQWLDYEWSDCNVTAEVVSTDFSPLLNKTFSCDDYELTVVDVHPVSDDEINAYKGTYDLDKGASMITYSHTSGDTVYLIKTCEVIPLRDNNWDAIILSIEGEMIEADDLVINSITLLPESGDLMVDGNLYKIVV